MKYLSFFVPFLRKKGTKNRKNPRSAVSGRPKAPDFCGQAGVGVRAWFMIGYMLFFFPFVIKGQMNHDPHLSDTIYCSSTSSTVLLFPAAISLVDLGTASFIAKTEEKVLLLKAARVSSGYTSLFVRYGKEEYFTGFVGYDSSLHYTYYDFREVQGEESGAISSSRSKANTRFPDSPIHQTTNQLSPGVIATDVFPEALDLGKARDRLQELSGLKRELFTIGKIAHHMELALENIRHDKSLSYLKLSLQNSSSLPYLIELISFRFREPVKGKGLSDMLTEIKPLLHLSPRTVDAHSREVFLVALPHFATPSLGSLEILLREKNGTRALIASVPSQVMMEAETVE